MPNTDESYPYPFDFIPPTPTSFQLIVLVRKTMVSYTLYLYDVIPPTSSRFIVLIQQTMMSQSSHPYDIIPSYVVIYYSSSC